MQDARRQVLSDVATHKITPEEAAARLEALEADADRPAGAAIAEAPPKIEGPVKRVRVVSTIGTAEIIGDPSVAYVVAEGNHRARQEGDTMVIEHQPFDESDTFRFARRRRRVIVSGLEVSDRRVTVRMNPNLPLVAAVNAGSLRVEGLNNSIEAEVAAGNCRIENFKGPLNVHVQAGSVTARGVMNQGESKIRCEMGAVKLHFLKGSSVRITARTVLGRVSVDGEDSFVGAAVLGDAGREVTIGRGEARLDIDSTMGSVKLWSEK
jgi:hypothetical protein